ncbi:MAG: hypothetical protein V1740_00310 [Candidatus Woesearchaeota archaeon]
MEECKTKGRVLIIGHDHDLVEMLGLGLACKDYDPVLVTDSRSALEMIEESEKSSNPFGLYIFDLAIGDMPYRDFLDDAFRLNGRVPVLLVSGFQDDKKPIFAPEGTYTIDFLSGMRYGQISRRESPFTGFVRVVEDICSGVPLNPDCTRKENHTCLK